MPQDPGNVYKGIYVYERDDPNALYQDEYYQISEINRRHYYIFNQIQKEW